MAPIKCPISGACVTDMSLWCRRKVQSWQMLALEPVQVTVAV